MIRRFRLHKRSDKTRNRRFAAAHYGWRKAAKALNRARGK